MNKKPLEILKFLPKTNCQKCGYPSCLAFSFALASGAVHPKLCPEIPSYLFKELLFTKKENQEEAYVGKILENVQKKACLKDWQEIASWIGFEFSYPKKLSGPFLDLQVVISPQKISSKEGILLDPRDQILLYNYIIFSGSTPLTGKFVGLEKFPNSLSKVATLRRYAEERLAQVFTGKIKELAEIFSSFKSSPIQHFSADLAFEIWVLPKVPLRIHFFEGDLQEGLSSEVKILYDFSAPYYLDLESLVFCAERLVERCIEKLQT